MNERTNRVTEEVLHDHLRCRISGRVEDDLSRNYASSVVVMTANGMKEGHAAVRSFAKILKDHVPAKYEITSKQVKGPFAFIEWRACGRV